MPLQSGSRLGPYEILSPLGAGGMGEVYRAMDTRLGREVAIKVLPDRLASDADLVRRFEQEARAVAALSPAPELSAEAPEAPPELSRVLAHCLEKQPSLRFQSARDLAFALRAVASAAAAPRSSSGRRRAIESIAVLPLANAGGDAEAEYLSDGITETIISRLSRLSGLRVMSRSSVFRYKGADVDPIAVGRELNVGAVVSGRVLHRGDDLVIRVELVDLSDGSQLWGEQYNRKMADVFAIENEIATQISENLRLKLSGEEKQSLTRGATRSADAYRLYLQGRFYWNKRTGDGIRKGIDYFRRAIDTDPGYAGAYVGIAHSYDVLGFHAIEPPGETFPKAKAAARRALEIDPTLVEARVPLAYALFYYDWDWPEAQREIQRCLEEAPGEPMAHNYYGSFLTALGRFDEALASWRRAKELDPIAPVIRGGTGWCLFFARRYEEAIKESEGALELDPTFPIALGVIGLASGKLSRHDRAIQEIKKAIEPSSSTRYRADLAYAYAKAGRPEEARATLAELETLSQTRYVSPYFLAPAHAALGDVEMAFSLLEKAFAERSNGMTDLSTDPNLDDLRSDPRLADLIRRVGLVSPPTRDALLSR